MGVDYEMSRQWHCIAKEREMRVTMKNGMNLEVMELQQDFGVDSPHYPHLFSLLFAKKCAGGPNSHMSQVSLGISD